MDIELNFSKSDNDVWGFRITGGSEYDVPFTVINVTEDSIAEKGGLECSDVIVSVNGTPVIDLTHDQTHNLLLSVGNNLILGVKRCVTSLTSPVPYNDESNQEVSNIMQPYLEEDENFEHERQVQFELVNSLETNNVQEIREAASHSELEEQTHVDISAVKERKWSTFLQKPSHPKPIPKQKEELPKGEPYRVIIKKQKKKETQDVQETEKCLEDEVTTEIEQPKMREEDAPESNVVLAFEADVIEEEEYIDEERLSTVNDVLEELLEETDVNVNKKQDEKDAALEKFLEEKLMAVQKQLEELSKLPSTLQSTIDALNKQIACIVHTTSAAMEVEEADEANSTSENDVAEQILTEDENGEHNLADEELTEDENKLMLTDITEEVEDITRQPLEEENVEATQEDSNRVPELSEEEVEAQRREQEMLEKQQKEQEQNEDFKQRRLKQKPTLPLKPIERPIILPGGRRWSQPDDACPTVKHAKMSDEKIANTIETFSEVIVGKTKGINFMKYQPPPKNLDYLQRSDVYKLVHDLEPPVRGISSRASKILSEQDYFPAG